MVPHGTYRRLINKLNKREANSVSSNNTDETKQLGWYAHNDNGCVVYSPTPRTSIRYVYAGNGESHPTPKAMAKTFARLEAENRESENDDSRIHYDDGLFFVRKTDPCKQVELPPGTYSYHYLERIGEVLMPVDFRTDSFTKVHKLYDTILGDIDSFLKSESIYRKIGAFGTIYKRGILLYGPPGEGKSSLIRHLVANNLPKDAIVISLRSLVSSQFIKTIKATLADRLKVFIFEDLTDFLRTNSLDSLLNFLDGEESIDRSINIATTNYPELLPKNLVDRRGRFDLLCKVGHPIAEERAAILKLYLMREPTELEIEDTKGLSTATIREVAIIHHLRGTSLSESIQDMKKQSELANADFDERSRLGI